MLWICEKNTANAYLIYATKNMNTFISLIFFILQFTDSNLALAKDVPQVGLQSREISFQNYTALQTVLSEGPVISNLNATSSCSLHVDWQCPGVEVKQFIVYWKEKKPISEQNNSEDLGPDTFEYDIESLIELTNYEVWVVAVARFKKHKGQSKNAKTLETSDIVNLTALCIESTSMKLSWEMIYENCLVDSFLIEWDAKVLWSPDKTSSETDVAEEPEYYMTNLIPYSSYNICVSAIGTGGSTGNMSCITEETLQGKAGKPTNVEAIAVTPSEVDITWSKPYAENGVISGYLVQWILISEGEILDSFESSGTNRTKIRVDDLLSCGNYTFTVSAMTDKDRIKGEKAKTRALTLPEASPSVTEFNYTSLTSTSANLTWSHPYTLCPIVQYSLKGIGHVRWSDRLDFVSENVTGEATSYVLQDLVPMTKYSISITPTTEGGPAENFTKLSFETLEGEPSLPMNLESNEVSTSEVSLTWDPPASVNGILLYYDVTWKSENFLQSKNATEETTSLINLSACTIYNIQVSGVTGGGLGQPANTTAEMGVGAPPPPKSLNCSVEGPNSIHVVWTTPDTKCEISNYILHAVGDILWSEDDTQDSGNTLELEYRFSELVPYTNYDVQLVATTGGGDGSPKHCSGVTEEDVPGPPRNLTKVQGIDNKNSLTISWSVPLYFNGQLKGFQVSWDNGTDFVLYDNNNPSYTYRIENLKSGTKYQIYVKGETNAGFGEPASMPFWTNDGSSVIVLCLLIPAFIILVLIIFGYIFRNDLKPKLNKLRAANPSSENEEILEINTAPIPLSRLRTHLQKLQSGNSLNGEFNSLAAASYKGSTREGEKHHNKNRYANILPYDSTRVPLRTGSSSYINANYISSFHRPKFFIATQGPNDDTLEDFWNLIWQENVDIIVMLATCLEAGKPKCSQYWPIPLVYGTDLGDFSIQNIHEEATLLFSLRMLEVTNRRENIKRLVKQYHFTAWPDFGAPERDDEILRLLFAVKKKMKTSRDNQKMLIHCSAGVGRTGTFIALWNLIEEIESGREAVSVVREVLSLRRQRVMMVQSQDQYLYLFKSIVAYSENLSRWQVKPQDFQGSFSEAYRHPIYGDGPPPTCGNPGFEASFEFEGNLI